jgi:hypothetical protein
MKVTLVIMPIVLLSLFLTNGSHASTALDCAVTGSGDALSVTIRIPTPHPGEMIINTPDGRIIWLQADHIPFPHPATDDFIALSEFAIDKRTRGSWFNDWGEPEAVSILSVAGTYELVITHDAESGRRDADTLTCEFFVTANGD